MASAIADIQKHADKIKTGNHDKIGPGRPARLSTALLHNEAVAQGDLLLIAVDKVPAGYTKVEHPENKQRQLAPGSTPGASHWLDSLDGVTLYMPEKWGEEGNLNGPCLVVAQERSVGHPTHGAVVIDVADTPRVVLCKYAREFDAEQQRERRAQD